LSVAFIFDMDGVIVDSNPYHKKALQQFCKKYGQHLTEEQLREKIYGRRNQDWLTNVFGKLDADQLKKYADEKEALFRELYEHDIEPVTGLTAFLKKMDEQRVVRAIATSAPADNVTFTLQKTQTGPFFKTILDDSFVTHGKPDPEIYIKTAKALNFEPKNCVVFEDSLAGVQSAKSAGCKVVGITTTHSREELSGTDLIIDDFVGKDPQKMISQLFYGKA
jgi:HAD superfamily hydrolase (TIGR01509 family)